VKIFNWCLKNVWGWIKFPFSGWKNFLFFVLSLPAVFGLLLIGIFLSGGANPFLYQTEKDRDGPANIHESDIVYLEQGWDHEYRQKYYFTAQGSHIIPLEMALALESPKSDQMIFGPEGTAVKQFGYLPYSSTAAADGTDNFGLNPQGLPIGFVEDVNRKGKSMLGINCAGCHASNMLIEGRTVRIDGGAALGDFMGLLGEIDTALVVTMNDPLKRARYALRRDIDLDAAFAELEVASVERQAWQRRNRTEFPHGYARVDAFSIIFNQVVARDLHLDTKGSLGNIQTPKAPASYPVLWDTPYMGRVQWTGGSNNKNATDPLARNIGQVLGVFGGVELTVQNSLPGYCSTPKRKNLELYNFWLQTLKSPKWEDTALKGIIPDLDPELVARGKLIYNGDLPGAKRQGTGACISCHGMVEDAWRDRPRTQKEVCDVPIRMVSHDTVQTDRELIDTGRRQGALTGQLAGQKSKMIRGKTLGARESYMLVLAEMIQGSFAGAYLSASCDGDVSPANLIETANTFGYFAKQAKESKKQREADAKKQRRSLTSGGFSLSPEDVESSRTHLTNARDILREVKRHSDVKTAVVDLSRANAELAKSNLDRAHNNTSGAQHVVNLPPENPEGFQSDLEKGQANLDRAQENLDRAKAIIAGQNPDDGMSAELGLLDVKNLKMAELNFQQAQTNMTPKPSAKNMECRKTDNYSSYAYKARPLNGIWASAPYLHNGSVPTLYDMLLPPADSNGNCPTGECRPSKFYVGSTQFDPVKVGFDTSRTPQSSLVDTGLTGNRNTGHMFRQDLSHEDRLALIEYLKSL
jgi:mono/diheme cytochrome c family protein